MTKTIEQIKREHEADLSAPRVNFETVLNRESALLAHIERLEGAWISVEDRLPEPRVNVLVGHMNQWQGWWPHIATHDGERWRCPNKVTHWIPLPETPRRDE